MPWLRVLTLVFFLTGLILAAPPTVTHLMPAGGQRGSRVEVSVAGTFDAWPVVVWSSHPGVKVAPGKEKAKLLVEVAADAEPGVAWLRLHDKQGASGLRPFVVGTLAEIIEKEPNDEPTKAQKIEPAACVVNGQLIKPGDVDCFRVELKKGQVLVASLLARRTLRSPMDAILQITRPDGFVLDQNHDTFDLDPHLEWTAPSDGPVIVRVFAFPSMPDSSIRFMGAETYVYRLTLTTGGYIHHAWPLALPREKAGEVELVGPNVPPGTRVEARETVWHPNLAGSAKVRLEPHVCLLLGEVKDQPAPFTVSGRLTTGGQVATIPVVASKGKPLVIQVEAESVESSLTPLVRVLDAAGKQLAKAEAAFPGKDVEVSVTPTQDGPIRVEVSDLYRSANSRGWFRLRVVAPEPDFSLTVASDRVAITPGKPIDLVVTVVRRNGLKGEISLTAEGLPEGVKAEMQKPAMPDAKTLTLRFTGEKAAQGAIQIVGKITGSERPRHAEATLADLSIGTRYLWLQVNEPAGK